MILWVIDFCILLTNTLFFISENEYFSFSFILNIKENKKLIYNNNIIINDNDLREKHRLIEFNNN